MMTTSGLPKPITREKLLLVEGQDEVNFFESLLRHMDMVDLVDIQPVAGKMEFKNRLPALQKVSGFDRVEAIAVIRDADEDAQSAFASIAGILKKNGLSPPGETGQFSGGRPRAGIYIMPGNSDRGMLEDLCLKTVSSHEAMGCVEDFITCVNQLEKPPKNISKAKAQAFLAAMPETANSVGIGAQKGLWDLDSPVLRPLIRFLTQLR